MVCRQSRRHRHIPGRRRICPWLGCDRRLDEQSLRPRPCRKLARVLAPAYPATHKRHAMAKKSVRRQLLFIWFCPSIQKFSCCQHTRERLVRPSSISRIFSSHLRWSCESLSRDGTDLGRKNKISLLPLFCHCSGVHSWKGRPCPRPANSIIWLLILRSPLKTRSKNPRSKTGWSGPLICVATSPQLDLLSLIYFPKSVLYTSTNLRPPLLGIGPG